MCNSDKRRRLLGSINPNHPRVAHLERKDWAFYALRCQKDHMLRIRQGLSAVNSIAWHGGEYSLFGNVDLALTEPLYTLPRKAGNVNSEHDVSTQEDISDLIESCLEFTAVRSHVHIFCPCLQFGGIVSGGAGSEKEASSTRMNDCKEPAVQMTARRVLMKPLHYMRDPERYTSAPALMPTCFLWVDAIVVHFWRTGLRSHTMLDGLSCQTMDAYLCTSPPSIK